MKKFKVVFREIFKDGYQSLTIEADDYATCDRDFFDFYINLKPDPEKEKSPATETVCMVNRENVLYIL